MKTSLKNVEILIIKVETFSCLEKSEKLHSIMVSVRCSVWVTHETPLPPLLF